MSKKPKQHVIDDLQEELEKLIIEVVDFLAAIGKFRRKLTALTRKVEER